MVGTPFIKYFKKTLQNFLQKFSSLTHLSLTILPPYSICQKNYLGHFFTHPVWVLKWCIIKIRNYVLARKTDLKILGHFGSIDH